MIRCDKCSKDFELKVRTKKHIAKGVTEIYLVCPYCKARYTSYFTNTEIKKLQRELNDLNKKLALDPDNPDLKFKVNELKSRLKFKIDDLKIKMLS